MDCLIRCIFLSADHFGVSRHDARTWAFPEVDVSWRNPLQAGPIHLASVGCVLGSTVGLIFGVFAADRRAVAVIPT